MKVIRLIGRFGSRLPRGPYKMAYNLTAELAKRGIMNTVYACQSVPPIEDGHVRTVQSKPIVTIGHYRINPALLGRLIADWADVVHVHGYRNFESDSGAVLSGLKGIPLVMTCHGTVTSPLQSSWAFTSRLPDMIYDGITSKSTLKHAEMVVAASSQEGAELMRFGVPASRIRVIPHGVELPQFESPSRRREGPLRVLQVTRLTHKNNVEMAIKGFAKAHDRHPNMMLTIVGDELPSKYVKEEYGYKARLMALCGTLGITGSVRFTGWLSGDSLWREYTNSDIFLWTSRHDNFGHALVEAAHFGLPLVSTDVGVASDLIGGGRGGILVGQDNTDQVAESLIALAQDPASADAMATHNKTRAGEYSVQRMAEGYLKLYREVSGR